MFHHIFKESFTLCVLTLFQGRLNELMSQIRMQNHFGTVRSEERYSVDADLLREIKQVRQQHFYTLLYILLLPLCCAPVFAEL